MLNVTFTKDAPQENYSIITVNGSQDKGSFCFDGGSSGWYCDLHDQGVFNKLSEYSFKEVGELLSGFNFPVRQSEESAGCRLRVICRDEPYGKTGIFVEFESNADFWARPYSIVDLAAKFKDIVEAENRNDIEFTAADDESLFNGFGIFWTVATDGEIIKSTIGKAVELFFEFEAKAERATVDSMDKENLVTYFAFPDQIRIACKQYLVYFAQFLLDLGIEAETEIKEQVGKTLFKIVPADKNTALDKIKEALEIYLNAPGAPNSEFDIIQNADVSVMQWQANVMHLKAQLMLAKSGMQMKDATIEMLSLSNYQYQQLTLKNNEPTKTQQEEDIIKGIVSVKHYEGKGFSINLPEILRRLKRRFGK